MAASRRASLKKQGEFVFLISVANYSIAVNTTVPLKKQDAFVFLISLASYARVSPKKQDGFAFFDRCSFRFDGFLSCRCCIYSLIYANVDIFSIHVQPMKNWSMNSLYINIIFQLPILFCLIVLFDDIIPHFQQYFSYIVAVSFIDGGNRSTRRKPLTCRKSLTNFIK